MHLLATRATDPPQATLQRLEDLGIELARWPAVGSGVTPVGRDRSATPRLYLVEEGFAPPAHCGPFEDWARLPAPEDELFHRARTLLTRANAVTAVAVLDDLLLRVDGRSIILSDKEASLLRMLLDQPGQVVTSEDIVAGVWPGEDISDPPEAIHNPLRTLRRRLLDTPVRIHTVRGRGLLVELQPAQDQPPIR